MKVKFGIFADLHIDLMPDCEARMEVFMEACKKENPDFLIHLGDFSYPEEGRKCICKPENTPPNVHSALTKPIPVDTRKVVDMYHAFEKPVYHTIGNHECDMCSKKQIMDYLGFDAPYYSFDCGGVHFVVLDASYGKVRGQYVSYENGNYFDWPQCIPYLPDEELAWLKQDLAGTKYPAVLFSHQRLMAGNASVKNAEDLRYILKNAPHGVILSANGHEHIDSLEKVDDTYFWNVNSMSCYWVSSKFVQMGVYGAEMDEKFPDVRHVIPYRDALFAFVTIDNAGITIRGRISDYVGASPKALEFFDDPQMQERRQTITAQIRDRHLPLK